ncbi:MAG TPA: carboxypeptidase regulatory-like domain-containing protein [Bryobacteraceae bacterium]|nr:carboxypeptidase regulatory-like domain-containing protein [Bryobacteraceae bacterium]
MFSGSRAHVIAVLFVASVLSSPLSAQVVSATLTGNVVDASGASVPNATVRATNVGTGTVVSTTTTMEGVYTLTYLTPGSYNLEIEAQGFKKFVREGVTVNVSSTVRVDASMVPGTVSESVTVTGEAPLLQTDRAEVAKNFTTQTVVDLPVANRNFQALAGLLPGVSPPVQNGSGYNDPAGTTFFNANGQGNSSNNTMIDGVDDLDPVLGFNIYLPAVELVDEVHVATSNYAAEFGRVGGATINVITKGGTNQFHGSLWEFNRVAAWAARDFFNTTTPKPGLTRNDFGVTLGGPIRHNKTFFFGSYGGRYLRQSSTTTATVPDPAWLNGDFSAVPGLALYDPTTGNPDGTGRTAFPGNKVPTSQMSPIATKLASYFPAPDLPGILNNYVVNVPYSYDANSYDGRVDHNFNESTRIFGRVNTSWYNVLQGGTLGNIIGDGVQGNNDTTTATINLTHGFSPTLLSELRLGYNRYRITDAGPDMTTVTNAKLGIFNPNPDAISLQGIASFQISGMPNIGLAVQYPLIYTENLFNVVDTWSKSAGKHALKWGVEIHRNRMEQFQAQGLNLGSRGLFSFNPGTTQLKGGPGLGSYGSFVNSYAAFLLGAPDKTGRTLLTQTPTNRQTQFFAFVQDTYQMTRNLTLELGMRYELYTTIKPRGKGGASNYDPSNNSLLIAGYGDIGLSTGVQVAPHDFAPRVGFAYRMGKATVVRGGYGISYWTGRFGFTGGTLSTQFPVVNNIQQGNTGDYIVDGTITALPAVPAISLPSNGIISPAPDQAFFVVPFYNPMPYVQSYNLMVQRELLKDLSLEVGYVGNLGRQLPYNQSLNVAAPGTGAAGLPFVVRYNHASAVSLRANGVNSHYNALQVNLSKRFSYGLTFTAAYAWSKSIDVGSNQPGFTDNLDLNRQYGPSDFDRTQMFTFSHEYELPFGKGKPWLQNGPGAWVLGGWKLNGIYRFATGTPFTATADATSCNCPGNGNFANVLGPIQYLGGIGTGHPWFTTSSFGPPTPNQFGNAGRNTIRGPGLSNEDFSIFRRFQIKERFRLEYRAEFYNLTNTPHFGNPSGTETSGSFGIVTKTLGGFGNRQAQMALRLTF